MPAKIYSTSITGLSTTGGFPTFYCDLTPQSFNVGVAVTTTASSSTAGFSVQHTFDYTGSSDFISSNATWFNSTGISGLSTSCFTRYDYPVTAIRLNSTAGSSTNVFTLTVVQAG